MPRGYAARRQMDSVKNNVLERVDAAEAARRCFGLQDEAAGCVRALQVRPSPPGVGGRGNLCVCACGGRGRGPWVDGPLGVVTGGRMCGRTCTKCTVPWTRRLVEPPLRLCLPPHHTLTRHVQAVACLSGCDYSVSGGKGVGVKMALEAVQQLTVGRQVMGVEGPQGLQGLGLRGG
jgi:hypothetical protein